MKKLISMVLAFAVVLSLTVVNAASPKISGTSVDARCGDEVDVTFRFTNNPGIAEADIMLSWDKSVLTLTDAFAEELFEDGTVTFDDATEGKLYVNWSNGTDVAVDGDMFTVSFEVDDNANISNYFISIGVNGEVSGLSNAAGEEVRTGLSLPNVSVTGTAVAEPTVEPTATPTPTRKPQNDGGGGGTVVKPTAKPTATPTVAPTPAPTEAPQGGGSDVFKPAFTDVKETDWFVNSVTYVYTRGLMNGVSDTEFGPQVTLTRAMLVTVLWRLENEPVVNYLMTFDDIPAEEWYTEAVRWAAAEGIVNGYSDTEFAPNAPITREQIATIIYKYADYKGIAPEGAWAIRLDYADLQDIADYATDGVMYCKLAGIMEGKGDNKFEPKAAATRAEIATVLQRFIEGNK